MRYRRTLRRAISRSLQKYKHVVDGQSLNVNAFAAVQNATIAAGADNPTISQSIYNSARSRIKAIYFEAIFNLNSANNQEMYHWMLWFNPQQSLTQPDPKAIGTSVSKSYIFKQGLVHITTPSSALGGIPQKIYGLVKIPAKYQRLMNGDAIWFSFSAQNINAAVHTCTTKFIYKEVRG